MTRTYLIKTVLVAQLTIGAVTLPACMEIDHPSPVGSVAKPDLITWTDAMKQRPETHEEGREILNQCERAYAKIQSCQAAVKLKSRTKWRHTCREETRQLKVLFQRPERIRLVGTDANADEFSIVSDGLAVELCTSAPGISGARNAIREALVEAGGISLQATLVPNGFLGI